MTKNQFIHLAVIHAINEHTLLYISDGDMIKCFKKIAKFADELDKIAPFDKEKNSNSAEIFDGYRWPKEGATRSEIEAWLKETTGKTSNRSMQSIINNALEDGVIHKDLGTHKYHPGKSKASA